MSDESFSEIEVDGEITYRLSVSGKVACEAVLLGRSCLIDIKSYPPNQGHGTKMMDYTEKKALESGCSTMEVTDIKDEQYVKDFFTDRCYKLEPHPQIQDEFIAIKRLTSKNQNRTFLHFLFKQVKSLLNGSFYWQLP
jgi:hypothetical protein